MHPITVYIDGIGFWSAALPDWPAARAALRGGAAPQAAAARPGAALLPPAERRRAPDTVLLALEVAAQAVQAAHVDPAETASVFASTYGDLGMTDHLCATLVDTPLLVSPTRFHHSVHNAAAGYWTIATGCRAASSALAGWDASFAGGLLEAAAQCAADAQPVLLAACDGPAVGALASVAPSTGLLGLALVLAPRRGAHTLAACTLALEPGAFKAPPPASAAAQALAGNAMRGGLPFFEALAAGAHRALVLPMSAAQGLHVGIEPLVSTP